MAISILYRIAFLQEMLILIRKTISTSHLQKEFGQNSPVQEGDPHHALGNSSLQETGQKRLDIQGELWSKCTEVQLDRHCEPRQSDEELCCQTQRLAKSRVEA